MRRLTRQGLVLVVAAAGCGAPVETGDTLPAVRSGPGAEAATNVDAGSPDGAAPVQGDGAAASAVPTAYDASWADVPLTADVRKGLDWLVSVQGEDGGFGQDGGHSGDARQGVELESQGNDVANTALAALAMVRAGSTPRSGAYAEPLRKALDFVLRRVESAPAAGLDVGDVQGTQIQRKLGRDVGTFLASFLLSEIDGRMPDEAGARRVHDALAKVLDKVRTHQQADGSWNTDGWAPLLSTSLASRSLWNASNNGYEGLGVALERVDGFTRDNTGRATVAMAEATAKPAGDSGVDVGGTPAGIDGASFAYGGGAGGGGGAAGPARSAPGAAGVGLYAAAQSLEQLSRTGGDRAANGKEIDAALTLLADERFVAGFGSMGGEEFVSYLNVSDSLTRVGGDPWKRWNDRISQHVRKLQNADGTWSGHHCITGRVACTSAAVMTLLAERTLPRGD